MTTPSSAVTVTLDGACAVIRLGRAHGNAINPGLVEGLFGAFREAEKRDEVAGVLLAASGRIFCPGLDLQELTALDRPAMRGFMLAFSECLRVMYTLPKPLVAGVGGHALAGGCVLALTADWRVLRRGALIGLNEVRVGVPLPYGVAQLLRDSVHRPRLEEVALVGRNYADEEAVATGLVHEIREADAVEARARERLEEMISKTAAFAVTKRYLREVTAERIRIEDEVRMDEWLDVWFSEGTQRRVAEVVASLRAKEAGHAG